jgi:hypothetical protein
MLHFDFNWDLNPDSLIFDEELPLHKLGWVDGDYFKLVEDTDTGVRKLVKVNELEKFILKGNKNDRS